MAAAREQPESFVVSRSGASSDEGRGYRWRSGRGETREATAEGEADFLLFCDTVSTSPARSSPSSNDASMVKATVEELIGPEGFRTKMIQDALDKASEQRFEHQRSAPVTNSPNLQALASALSKVAMTDEDDARWDDIRSNIWKIPVESDTEDDMPSLVGSRSASPPSERGDKQHDSAPTVLSRQEKTHKLKQRFLNLKATASTKNEGHMKEATPLERLIHATPIPKYSSSKPLSPPLDVQEKLSAAIDDLKAGWAKLQTSPQTADKRPNLNRLNKDALLASASKDLVAKAEKQARDEVRELRQQKKGNDAWSKFHTGANAAAAARKSLAAAEARQTQRDHEDREIVEQALLARQKEKGSAAWGKFSHGATAEAVRDTLATIDARQTQRDQEARDRIEQELLARRETAQQLTLSRQQETNKVAKTRAGTWTVTEVGANLVASQVGQVAIAPATAEENEEIEREVAVSMMSSRAEKKWNQLDTDQNGSLEGIEIVQLAEWVGNSFKPGKSITKEETEEEAVKLLERCDIDGDGIIDRVEFEIYYSKTAAAMFTFHKTHARAIGKGEL